eukprot:TRINITY_DN3295_c0_g3_i3.p1 TRINITY_DN3295_c0_g3~~TRINITY_DN3295_c0_g3_i3.p1  ORF type:complete len:300 (+),score=60.13 TRINITY_DN3295_c0_g3_i3:69-968(+)
MSSRYVIPLLPVIACGILMPDGRDYIEECIHHLEEGDQVISSASGGDIIVSGSTGERRELPPCPTGQQRSSAPAVVAARYFSSWVVDTVAVHEGITSMVSNWTVPKEPTSRGPLPGISSAYLFNGLEDGGGVHGKASMILQPVLSFGKSGCVLNPFAGWILTAFQVTGAGRAYCGSKISVKAGDEVSGVMELVGERQWKVIADAGKKGRSTHLVTSDFKANAAYLTLEGMIIYNCHALPSESVTFRNNVLTGEGKQQIRPSWKSEIRRKECNPSANIRDNGDVELSWDKSGAEAVTLTV